MRRFYMTIALLLMYVPAWGATYYVDATGGNDSNAGTATNNAWKTISKVNASSFSAGDSILFKRGETWREQLTVPSSGGVGNVITFGVYGTGTGPKILGSINKDTTGDWMTESGLWSASISSTPNSVWRDGVIMTKVTNKVDIGTDTTKWWWDSGNMRVYVYGGVSAPTTGGHTFEIAQRNSCIIANSKDYLTIDGLTCQYTNLQGIYIGVGSDYVTVQNTTVSNTYTTGIYFNTNSNANILSNIVSYAGQKGTAVANTIEGSGIVFDGITTGRVYNNNVSYSGRVNICIYDGRTSNVTIENNTVHNSGASGNHGYGIQIYSTSTAMTGIIIRYNYSYLEGQMNLYFSDHIHNPQVYYNILSTPGQNAAGEKYNIGGDSVNGVAYNIESPMIFNNIFYIPAGVAGADWYNFRISGNMRMEGAIIKNNVFYNGSGDKSALSFASDTTHATPPVLNYNLYYMPNTSEAFNSKPENIWYDTWAAYQAAGYEARGINANPVFVSEGTDFYLQSYSPAIDVGTNVSFTTDYKGKPVPFGSAPDIGAFEYQGILHVPSSPGGVRIN